MMKNIFKGKKNLYVVEAFTPESFGQKACYNVFNEFNIKKHTQKSKTYPTQAREDYLKAKMLKPVTYAEFESALKGEYENVKGKISRLFKRLNALTDEKANVEFRHFMYEFNSGVKPLLTEGLIKSIAIARLINDLYKNWNDIVSELNAIDSGFGKYFLAIPETTNESLDFLNILTDEDYCDCVVKSNKYVFDYEIEDENEEDVTPAVPVVPVVVQP